MAILRANQATDWLEAKNKPDYFEVSYLPGRRLCYRRMGEGRWGLMREDPRCWFTPTSPLIELGVDQMMLLFVTGVPIEEVFA
jgi:hypothetical protein